MRRRPLGARGPQVSEIGLGTVKLGRTRGLKYPAPSELPSDEQVRGLLGAAMDLGVNLIDTAPAYGLAEERVGAMLPAKREDWVICTKAGESFERGASSFDFSGDAIKKSVDGSLHRLRTDYVDVLLAHSDGQIELDLVESGLLDTLQRIKQSGKARLVGVSVKTLEGARLAIEHGDVVMLTLNPLDTESEPAIELARERGVGVLVKKALASGHVDRIHAESGESPADAAIRFALNHAGVSSVVIGTSNPDHLAQSVHAALTRSKTQDTTPDIITQSPKGARSARL
ncbi:MAG: aldo/keto reductase [Phycisphaerales bacterium]